MFTTPMQLDAAADLRIRQARLRSPRAYAQACLERGSVMLDGIIRMSFHSTPRSEFESVVAGLIDSGWLISSCSVNPGFGDHSLAVFRSSAPPSAREAMFSTPQQIDTVLEAIIRQARRHSPRAYAQACLELGPLEGDEIIRMDFQRTHHSAVELVAAELIESGWRIVYKEIEPGVTTQYLDVVRA